MPVYAWPHMMNALKAKLRALAGSYPLYREKFIAAQGIALSDGTPEDFDAFVRDQIRADRKSVV